MTRLNLTYLINKIDYGGAEIGAVRLLSGLDHDQFDVTLATLKEINPDLKAELPDRVTIHELRLNSKPSFRDTRGLWRSISNADVLVGSLFPSIVLGSMAGTVCRVPKIYVWRHNTTEIGRFRKQANLLSFRLADGVFVDSNSTKTIVSGWGIADSAITILPLSGIEIDDFPRVTHTRSETSVRIGTVGRLVEQKGYPELLECAARLPEFEFHIVGDGSLSEDLKRSPDNVVLHGRVEQDELYRLWRSFDVYFQPSRHEGLCITAIEAMACGLPVVASDVNGLTESIVDGTTGYLVPQGDIGGYCDALSTLADDPPLRSEFGTAGRHRVEERYTRAALAVNFTAAVREIT